MSKTTTASVERDLLASLQGFKDRANAAREAYQSQRQDILRDERLSDAAKTGDLAKLSEAITTQLASIKADQDAYVSGLKSKIEKELRGNQPADANSVLLRRDASDRARKLDRKEAMEVLQDAISNGDAEMAHAVGQKARNLAWLDVAEAYTAAHPDTADSAAALAHVEANTSGAAWNLSNGISFAAPID